MIFILSYIFINFLFHYFMFVLLFDSLFVISFFFSLLQFSKLCLDNFWLFVLHFFFFFSVIIWAKSLCIAFLIHCVIIINLNFIVLFWFILLSPLFLHFFLLSYDHHYFYSSHSCLLFSLLFFSHSFSHLFFLHT